MGHRSILHAALAYWAAIFALGFALGTVRTLWLAPALGELAAVALELPVMLGASAWAAHRLTRRHAIAAPGPALAMGALAFALLLAAELALALALGRSAGEWLASLGEPPGLLGLAGQVAFALMPLALRPRG
jgi:hypothetical protein